MMICINTPIWLLYMECLARIQIYWFHDGQYVLNVFIDIQTSKELIQMDTDKMMTYGTFTTDDEKLTQS